MKKSLQFVIVVFIMQQYTTAQTFDTTWANRFQTVLDSVVAVNNIMGASASVLVPGEGIWTGVSGNSVPGDPLTPAMRLGIGSNTKLFNAVVMAKLQEEGVLSLDDHLDQWLPAFQFVDSSITIRQLLSHQSGIFNFTDNGNFWNVVHADTGRFWTPEEVLDYLNAPNFEPGTGWRYSNTNYILAGMIIEAATGETWVQKLHDIIFDPLGMDSTFVGAYDPPNGPVAGTQWMWGGGGPWYTSPLTSVFSSCGSAGSIFSTSREMVQWYHALFSGEILSDSSLQQILDFEAGSLFGLGIWSDGDISLSYPWHTHTGGVLGYISQIVFDVKTHSVFCLLTNNGFDPNELFSICIDPMMHVLYAEYPKKQNDAGITQIIDPREHICMATVTPLLILKNFGSDPLTSVTFHFKLDEGSTSNYTWTGNLNPGDTDLVSLEAITPGNGLHTLICYTSAPNSATDGYPYNDTATIHLIENLWPSATIPLMEDFDSIGFPPEGWLVNPNESIKWGRTTLRAFSGTACATKCNFWDRHIGARYNFDLPLLDLTNTTYPTLSFTYAYTSNSLDHGDTLSVLISDDCGSTWQTLFYEGGMNLRTAPPTTIPFFPIISQWKTQVIPLTGYTGNVIIRFQDIGGHGNNLFLDDVHVQESVGNNEIIANEMGLQIFPNPFSDYTTFEYKLENDEMVTLTIFNHLSQEVEVLVDEQKAQGKHQVQWNAEGLPAGVYFYRLSTIDHRKSAMGKLVIAR